MAAFVLSALGALAFVACSNQGEGERCDHLGDNNGTDECQDPLVCTAAGSLNGSPSTDRCCPVDRTTATTVVCSLSSNAGMADGAIPLEGGGPDVSVDGPTPVIDGALDAGTDAADAG